MGGCVVFLGVLLAVPVLALCAVFPPAIVIIPLVIWMLAADARDKIDEITHPRSKK